MTILARTMKWCLYPRHLFSVKNLTLRVGMKAATIRVGTKAATIKVAMKVATIEVAMIVKSTKATLQAVRAIKDR